jgi:hypothetical protein
MGEACDSRGAEEKCTSTVFVRNSKRPTGSPRPRWQVGIKADLTYIRWIAVDWLREAQDREDWWAVVNW